MRRYIIREEPEPLSPTGTGYRAYFPDGVPLYMGEFTEVALRAKIAEYWPDAVVELETAVPT